MIEAIVLAGGFGTRLQQVVSDLPKPMAPVAGKPFLEILLSELSKKGFKRIILSVGYMADKIISYFGDEFKGVELVYEIEDRPLGTGGAVKQALQHCKTDHVFVFNGDTYLDLDVDAAELKWQKNKAMLIVAKEVSDTARYGRIVFEGDRIVGFSEKGVEGSGLINAGCYILPVSVLDDFELGSPFSLEVDFFAKVVQQQRIDVFVTNGHFIDIGIPEDYFRAQVELTSI
mgnify:CR=1 FL=1|jgi:D-glycero-alpha-D-manno-heptose 1-phosphate guanylyltransferase